MENEEILCKDSLVWLREQPDNSLPSIITGLPDLSSFSDHNKNVKEYTNFIEEICSLIFQKVKLNKYVIFQITDRKFRSAWISKQYFVIKQAMRHNCPLRFHKIILLRGVGKSHIHRPTYQHYLCFSHQMGSGRCTPDVFDGMARDGYNQGHTIKGIEEALDFLDKYDRDKYVLDPFVGRGSVLKRAKLRGYRVLGIDIDPECCQASKTLLA